MDKLEKNSVNCKKCANGTHRSKRHHSRTKRSFNLVDARYDTKVYTDSSEDSQDTADVEIRKLPMTITVQTVQKTPQKSLNALTPTSKISQENRTSQGSGISQGSGTSQGSLISQGNQRKVSSVKSKTGTEDRSTKSNKSDISLIDRSFKESATVATDEFGVQTHVIALISTNSALLHALSSLFQLRHQSHQPTPAAVSVDGILATCVKMSSKNNVAIYVVDNFQKMDDLLNEITLNVVVFCYEQSNDFDYQVLKKNYIAKIISDYKTMPQIVCSVKIRPHIERDVAGDPLIVDFGNTIVLDKSLKDTFFTNVDLVDDHESVDHLFVDALLLSTKHHK